VCGIFTADRSDVIREAVDHWMHVTRLDNVVYLCSKKRREQPALYELRFYLEDMSTKRSNRFLQVASLITPRTVVIFDDVETIRRYPQSMTRNIINHIAPLTRYKISAGGALIINNLYDLYAEFAILDKRILHANHYWCFKDAHREISVFDGKTVMDNKDAEYLAAKLSPFVRFDLEPENETQAELYAAMRTTPALERVQDISMLRLQ